MSVLPGAARERWLVGALGLLLGVAGLLWAGRGAFWGSADVDFWGTQWFYWLVGRRVLAAEPFAHTDLIFHPWGKEVYLHTGGNVVDAFAALPFRYVLGPVVGYNAFLAAILVTNGIAGARLGGVLGAGPQGRMGAGLLAALAPFVLWELHGGRPTQAILAPAALFLAAWLRPLGPRPGREGLVAGLWMGLTGLTYWFFAIFCAIAAGLALPLRWRGLPRDLRGELRFHSAAVAVALLLAMPLAWPMLRALQEGAVPGLLTIGEGDFLPQTAEGWQIGVQALDPLLLQAGFYVLTPAGLDLVEPIGVVSLLAVLLAAAGLWRRSGAWMGLLPIGGLLLVAAGPLLEPRLLWPNLFYEGLVALVSPLARLWWPARAVAIFTLLLLPFAALALDRLPRGGLLLLFGLLLGEGGLLGLWPPAKVSAAVPPIYPCLARGEGAVIELPVEGHPERQLYQALHGRPRFGGMLEDNPVFAPEAHRAFRAEDPGTAALIALSEGRKAPPGPLDLGPLRALGFTAVVVERAALGGVRPTAAAARLAERALVAQLGRPSYADSTHLLFTLAGAPPDCAPAARLD